MHYDSGAERIPDANRQPTEITGDRLPPMPNFIEVDLTADRLFS